MADRVLVAEENVDDARWMHGVLETAGFDVTVRSNGREALEWSLANRRDAVVLSVSLPGIDGFEVLRGVRRDHRTIFTVVVLTARSVAADLEDGWRLDPDDFLLKPIRADDLVARLSGRLRRTREALEASWTKLPSGTSIERHVRRLLDDSAGFALAHVDLDEFKAFNSRYGFVRGNLAIGLVASILQGVASDVAGGAVVGHIGGDDFVLVIRPDVAEEVARAVIDRFDREVPGLYDVADREAGFVSVQDRTRRVRRHRIMTISIGIATTNARRFRHYGDVAQVAAEMLLEAKREPRSSYRIDRRRPDD